MRLSLNALIAAPAAAAALLLAACAGQGVSPATSSFPSSSDLAKKPAPTPNPCTFAQQPWEFGGPCDAVALTATGATVLAKTYEGYSVKAVFPSGAPAGTLLVVRDATGKGDATGKVDGKTFPPFNLYGIVPVLYIKAHNEGAKFQFSATPKITVTATGTFPGTRCYLTKLLSTSDPKTNDTWQTAEDLVAYPSGHTLAFGTAGIPQQVDKGGTIYLAIGCK